MTKYMNRIEEIRQSKHLFLPLFVKNTNIVCISRDHGIQLQKRLFGCLKFIFVVSSLDDIVPNSWRVEVNYNQNSFCFNLVTQDCGVEFLKNIIYSKK